MMMMISLFVKICSGEVEMFFFAHRP